MDTKVTEEAAKLDGTAGRLGAVGVGEAVSGLEVRVWAEPAGLGEERCTGVDELDSAVGCPPKLPDRITRGTVIAPASTTTTPAAVSAARAAFRRRARLLIRSKVPGCGSKGVTRVSSQVSMSSRGSSM